MPALPKRPGAAPSSSPPPGSGPEQEALERLRQAENPFVFSVATSANEEECRRYDVPELLEEQRRDVLAVVGLYRGQRARGSQAFTILGDPGTGKTHLLTKIKRDLSDGRHLLVVADGLPDQEEQEPLDFFLWQVVGQFLARTGPGARVLKAVGARTTGRLLAEAVRRAPPGERLRLVPPRGVWDRVSRRLGLGSVVASHLKKLDQLLATCDQAASPAQAADVDLAAAAGGSGVDGAAAIEAMREHVEATESLDADGWLRRRLYLGLGRFSLLGDYEDLEGFLTGDFNQPEHVAGAGGVTRKLLTAMLDLLSVAQIPAVLIFDQLEDFLRAATPQQERELRKNFCRGLATLINQVPGLCVLVFAERGLWNEISGDMDPYTIARIRQSFGLPGRPAMNSINLPDRISPENLRRIIAARVGPALGDLKGKDKLPLAFPFRDADLQKLSDETSVRSCVQQLSRIYSGIVYAPQAATTGPASAVPPTRHDPPTKRPGQPSTPAQTSTPTVTDTAKTQQHEPSARDRLVQRWADMEQQATQEVKDANLAANHIPELHRQLELWLTFAAENQLITAPATGAVPVAQAAPKVQTVRGRHPLWGWLNVVHFDGAAQPGLGIAFWITKGKCKSTDLGERLKFFDQKPCPIRTLVLFRRDGTTALTSLSKELYDGARAAGRDVRVAHLNEADLVTLSALRKWLPSVKTDLGARPGPEERAWLRDFVKDKTGSLLRRLDQWRRPAAPEGKSLPAEAGA